MPEERTLSTRTIFQGRSIRLRVDEVMLPTGRRTQREVVEARGAVGIVAVDDDGCLLLVRQFRKPAGRELWEIPAGTLETGEPPLECARRELAEETGYRAEEFAPMASFYTSPGFCDEVLHLFHAKRLTKVGQALDEDEILRAQKVPVPRALEMIRTGEIADAKTIAGILLLRQTKETTDKHR